MKKESKRHILSTVAVILAAVAAVTVLFVLHHKQQQEKARQPEESISQEEDNTIEWNGKRYTYNNNLINILFLGIDHANDIDTSYMPGDAGQADCIMLLSLDKETKEGRILQINRNTMTQIDTYDSTGKCTACNAVCVLHRRKPQLLGYRKNSKKAAVQPSNQRIFCLIC